MSRWGVVKGKEVGVGIEGGRKVESGGVDG